MMYQKGVSREVKDKYNYYISVIGELVRIQKKYIRKMGAGQVKVKLADHLDSFFHNIEKANKIIKTGNVFNIESDIEMIRKAIFVSPVIRADWIFVLQEVTIRLLIMNIEDTKNGLYKSLKTAKESGIKFNDYVRNEINKLSVKDHADYEEMIDDLSDKITDLIKDLKENN